MKPSLFLFILFAFPAAAEIRLDIAGAFHDPMPVAVPAFLGESASEKELGERIAEVVTADLERSGLFRGLNPASFIQKFDSIDTMPLFPDWQVLNAQALLQGSVAVESSGGIKISFRLWDVFAGTQMEGKILSSTRDGWRQIAHMIADDVYTRITGEDAYFNSRIVYIMESGTPMRRVKRLAIMDQDGENHKVLTDGKDMVLTPRFSPNMQMVTYLSYFKGAPKVYILSLETGQQELVGHFPGMTFAPRFSWDSSKIVMSFADRGNSEIYEMDLVTKKQKRLTNHPAIDTSPSYSPDGEKIVFNSDRSGAQQLYVMDAGGGNAERISFGEPRARYATPVWSPRGDYIAFTKMLEGTFYVGVMHPDGSGERLLASGYLVEAPTWSPNGRVLTYFKQTPSNAWGIGGTTKIYTVDITGRNEQMLPTPMDGSDPAWSPLLH